MKSFNGIRVEVIPDEDAAADPRIPESVLKNLSQDVALIGLNMMYVRQSLWDKMKHGFVQVGPLEKLVL